MGVTGNCGIKRRDEPQIREIHHLIPKIDRWNSARVIPPADIQRFESTIRIIPANFMKQRAIRA